MAEQTGFPTVQGHCPACHRESLFLGSGGYVTCARIECPEPDAASTLLERTTEGGPVTTQPDRIALDDLTSDALDQLYDRLDLLENGARERSALLEEARDALEAAGINEAHGGESWPRLVPAIEELVADRDRLATALEQLAAVPDRTTLPELHQRIVDTVTTAYPDLRPVADDLGHLMLAARDQHIEQLEQRITGLEALVARVRQAVDAGPVGACCAHLIRAALNPPADLCGCGRPDPGPCQPCPDGSPSLHCACVCQLAVTKEIA